MPGPDDRIPVPGGSYTPVEDLNLLREVAREAGELALHWFQKGAQAWDKSPNNPVTEADIAVNDRIALRLMSARPTYGWLSEETRDDTENRDACRVFVVDPIDGTKAFIRGEPYFCIAIARLEKDQPVAAVIYNPSTDELYEAFKGGGAYLNGKPIKAGERRQLCGSRMVGYEAFFQVAETCDPWPNDIVYSDPVPNAMAYRICLVADGRWDAAVTLSPKSDWDLAAATLILEEAGGACTDHTGAAFSFNGKIPVQRSVIAAGARLHGLLVNQFETIELKSPDGIDQPPPDPARDYSKKSAGIGGRVQRNEFVSKGRDMSNQTPEAKKQLLHIVIGGELKDVTGVEFEDISKMEFVGAYGDYQAAYDAWKSAAQRTVDNAEMRFFILHAHRLLDPETGHTHDV